MEAWQNQRHYGITWRSPALLERAHWSDARGNPLKFDSGQSPRHCLDNWELVVTVSTDSDGWQYASVFKHFDYAREGGRASQRATDFVRRRLWRRRAVPSNTSTAQQHEADSVSNNAQLAAKAVTDALVSPTTVMFGARVRKQTEMERRKSVVRIFVGMFAGCIKRHQIWNIVPWDPGAWWVMYNQHQAALLDLQQKNMHTQVDIKALSQPTDQSQPNPADNLPEAEQQRPSLVRELLCAAIHSRAAYGYAMAAGHMSTLLNFALMHTLHQISFDAAGGASAEANNLAVAQLAGLDPKDVIMGEWSNSVMRPCHYVAADKANQCIILAIRGSLEVGDVLSDLSANPMELSLLGVQGKVHEGMMSAATFVHCNTAAALESAARLYPGWPLVVTGHSMGGGVAAIVAALLRDCTAPEGLGPVRCCVISPAAVFSGDLSEACRPFITSLILRSDAVPRLSYASVEGIFVELVGASPVRRAANDVKTRVEQMLEGLKMGWVFKKPARLGRPTDDANHGLNTMTPLLDDDDAIDAASTAALRAYDHSSPDRSKALKVDKADSPQRRTSLEGGSQGIVDAAQFAESMVPEGLQGPALSRNSSQTSLSGAAPGGVLDTGHQGTSLSGNSSQAPVPRALSSSALYAGQHRTALPRNASSRVLTGPKAEALPEAEKDPASRTLWSSLKRPWQGRKPGGAVRQWQPGHEPAAPKINPSIQPQNAAPATGACENISSSQVQVDHLSVNDADTLDWSVTGATAKEQVDAESVSTQAGSLVGKALSRIAAAQQAQTPSVSASPPNDSISSHTAPAAEQSDQKPAVLDISAWMKSNANSPVSPKSGAVSKAGSPQHNSRLRACAKSDRLRQLVWDSGVQRLASGCDSEGAQETGQGTLASQGRVKTPSEHPALLDADPAGAQAASPEGLRRGIDPGQGGVGEPLGLNRDDQPEGPQHADNPGSQAAALDSTTSYLQDSTCAHRTQQRVEDLLGISRLEPDGPPAPLYPPGRIIWMLPAPEKSASQDAHVAVADPDNAQHPEDSHMPDVQSAADDATSASASASASASVSDEHLRAEHGVGKAEKEEPRIWQTQPILLDVHKECFPRLLLLPEILVDHLPDTYLAAVQQL